MTDEPFTLRQKWKTRVGQVWALGPHRVMCGDSTNSKDVDRLMEGRSADVLLTSPPYMQQRTYRDGSTAKVSDWDSLMRGVFTAARMSDASQYLVNLGLVHRHGQVVPYWNAWIEWMKSTGRTHTGWYVWDKGYALPGVSSGRLGLCFEFVFHFSNAVRPALKVFPCKHAGKINRGTIRAADGTLRPMTDRGKPTQPFKIHDSVIRQSCSSSGKHSHGHPAPYPVGLVLPLIKSWPGLIYDPFLGSGTTLIAAHEADQPCYGMELSPAYTACILERFHRKTGVTPTLERKSRAV